MARADWTIPLRPRVITWSLDLDPKDEEEGERAHREAAGKDGVTTAMSSEGLMMTGLR